MSEGSTSADHVADGPLQIGQRVGSYRLVRKLGEGGTGAVFAAEHSEIGHRAAVKVLQARFAGYLELQQRLFNEAVAVNLVQHPGIVKIFEFGRLPDHSTYLIMEYLDGDLLSSRLQSAGRLAPADALRLTRQIASAMAAAHERNIIHRDLKPENVILVPDPEAPGQERVKIFDFGIAKLTAEFKRSGQRRFRTQDGTLIGTPLYMSPEQCRGNPDVDGKADVYSLGIMLYELIAGRTPFMAHTSWELLTLHVRATPRPLAIEPGVPPELSALVQQMLAKAPVDRPTMAEVAVHLERIGRDPAAGAGTERPSSDPGSSGPLNGPPGESRHAPGEVRQAADSAEKVALLGTGAGAVKEQGRRWRGPVLMVLAAVLLAGAWGVTARAVQERRDLEIRVRDILEEAQAASERSAELTTALSEADLGDARLRWILALSYHRLGLSLRRAGREAEARAAFDRSLELIRALLDVDPAHPEYRGAFSAVMADRDG